MDVKARIGLGIALIATIISLFVAFASIGAETAVAAPAPDSSIAKCEAANGAVTDITVVKDITVAGPCPSAAQLLTDARLNTLCKETQESWISQAKKSCVTVSGERACTINSPWATIFIRSGLADTRKCDVVDPGHIVKLTCTTKDTPICSHMRDCVKDCERIKKICLSTCGDDNAPCRQKCVSDMGACIDTCIDP